MINLIILNLLLVNLVSFKAKSNEFKRDSLVHQERLLFKHLFKDYDKNLRPSDTVNIKFALNLNQIITIIEQEQILVLNVFLDHEWIDERLKWDPLSYNNISLLRINSDLLWA